MRLIIMGTGPFAVPTLEALLDSSHDVLALVTRPGRPNAPAGPMHDAALAASLPVLQPQDVNTPQPQRDLASFQADLLVVCDYGQILSSETLRCAAKGGINLHGSLLPKYRGAAPINWAIYHGERETGVTVIHMTPRLDAGPCLVNRATAIGGEETAEELEPRLAELGATAVLEAIAMLESWNGAEPIGVVQDNRDATRAPRLKKTDGRMDWSRPARDLVNQVRAFKPWPGTYTNWLRREGAPLRLIIDRASVAADGDAGAVERLPGRVVRADDDAFCVATGQGLLKITSLQPAGKRCLPAEEFLRGYRIEVGEALGDAP